MNEIFDMMDEEKKVAYDKAYIEELYLKYQEKDRVQEAHLSDLKEKLAWKTVLMIAPGQSSVVERQDYRNVAKTRCSYHQYQL